MALTMLAAAGLSMLAASGAPAAPRGPAAPPGGGAAVDIDSRYGSGAFGDWRVDRFGLPAYRYTTDEQRAPRARQPELGGSTDAWHQVGNDRLVADAYNHGYVQLWSQDRRYEWLNRYDAARGHYSGGYGYLRSGGRTISTLYDDRPRAARTRRDFGAGYFHRRTRAGAFAIDEHVYAPFGDDPVLLHDVTIRNTSATRRRASWFEYWDVNPYDQNAKAQIGLGRPRYEARTRTLTVAQSRDSRGGRMDVFAAALRGRVAGFETRAHAFFGSGGRADPDAVAGGRLGGGIARAVRDGASGATLFALRSPLSLAPGRSVTLRYAYGYGRAREIAALVRRYRRARDPLARSERAWAGWLPQVALGRGRRWLSRELQWDAYMVRSGATYERCHGRHVITQGGYYTYAGGANSAFRDPLQHMLPMIYADPALARDVLVYSAQQQPRGGGAISYAVDPLCRPTDTSPTSDDLDLWLLLAASEYGLATRDRGLFAHPVRFRGGGRAPLWAHLKRAFRHQESLRTARGAYRALATGDWTDLSPEYLQMTESGLVTAQLAYVYPRLSQLATLLGDRRFAATLRRAGARDLRATRRLWTGSGWYARGYAGTRLLGRGVIFGEPQPWAILAGAPSPARARTLVHNIRRFLTGIGAPGGPSPIGSAMSPARDDPLVDERTKILGTGNSAVFPGQTWFAINGWLTWALGELQGTVPGAAGYAFDELLRNTLARHATVYPDHWDGIISVDDMCSSYYAPHPSYCGIAVPVPYSGQIMHQPAWSLFDAIKLAGIEPVARGYRIEPHLPLRSFSLRLGRVGVSYTRATARGYVTPVAAARLRMAVAVPRAGRGARCAVRAGGRRVLATRRGGTLRFTLRARAGRPASWDVACGGGQARARTPTGLAG